MRMTLDIPDPLHRNLKIRAATEGVTMKAILLRAAEAALAHPPMRTKRVSLPLIRSSKPGSLLLTNAMIGELEALEDIEKYRPFMRKGEGTYS